MSTKEKQKARERELCFAAETFNLIIDEVDDPERIEWARQQEERMRAEARRIEAERQQTLL